MAKIVHNPAVTEVKVVEEESFTLTLNIDEAITLRAILGRVAGEYNFAYPVWKALYHADVPIKDVRYFDGVGGKELTYGIHYIFNKDGDS
jgi:hypothetical protein